MPSMRGISTSSVITSGLRLRIISRAANGIGGRADHLHVGLLVDDLGEEVADQCGVVDDQHPDLRACVHLKSSAPPSIGPWKRRAP